MVYLDWISLIASVFSAIFVPTILRVSEVLVGKLSRALRETSSLLFLRLRLVSFVSLPIASILVILFSERSRVVSVVTFSRAEMSVSLLDARLRFVSLPFSAPLTSVTRFLLRLRVVSFSQSVRSGTAVIALPCASTVVSFLSPLITRPVRPFLVMCPSIP